jgi:AraC-like DNA-binding protein
MSSSKRKRSIHLNYKQGSGYSISDAIMKLRIEKAKQALTVPSSRVNDVSQQVGFLDTGTFIRATLWTGCTNTQKITEMNILK